ncbi:MAG TPA: helix-turn-helix domain-containing protein, partial [Bacteroidota bacterium]|nr:helix-turn-helix domain-containing protein [Bacteroidota bacterium]
SDGSFREDLYYRLNVFSILVPPLRERKSDIPAIADYFVRKCARGMGKEIHSISPEAMDLLISYDWPGNVRELENAIERAMVVGKTSSILPEELPIHLKDRGRTPPGGSLAALEKEYIREVLWENKWNISRSAEVLQIDRATLYNKIEKYAIPRPE